jgi:site-specific recombinase XerD
MRRSLIAGNVPGLIKETAMTPLRKQMDDAMVLRGFSLRTRESYLACVAALAKHYRCSPDRLDAKQIQAYLLYLIQERKLAYATVNQAGCAFRFLFGTVLSHTALAIEIPMAKAPKRLPRVLSREQITQLFAATATLRSRTVLMTTYAAGLRVSEVCALQVSDIESAPDRMCIKVRQAKGGKDRYTLLSARLLETLRLYWRACQPRLWLFPDRSGDKPMCIEMAQRMYYAACAAAGIVDAAGIHTLRHCFATHLLEAGVDIHAIQRLLGHGHVSTTTRYFHLTQNRLTGATSPLDLLEPPPH